jgi:hypothetical protein
MVDTFPLRFRIHDDPPELLAPLDADLRCTPAGVA